MIVLLNLLVVLVVGFLVFLSAHTKKFWPIVLIPVFIFIYMNVQPSYLPKGEVKRSDVPVFEQSEAEIEDRNRKPQDGALYDEKRNESIKEGLPFLKQ